MLCKQQMKLGRSCSGGSSGKLNSFPKPPETIFSVCGFGLLFEMMWIPRTSDTPTVKCKYKTHPSQGCWESWPLSIQGYSPWVCPPSFHASFFPSFLPPMQSAALQNVNYKHLPKQLPGTLTHSTQWLPMERKKKKKETHTGILANLFKYFRTLGIFPDGKQLYSWRLSAKTVKAAVSFLQPELQSGTVFATIVPPGQILTIGKVGSGSKEPKINQYNCSLLVCQSSKALEFNVLGSSGVSKGEDTVVVS